MGLGVGAKRGEASQLHFEMFFKLKYVCKFWCGPNALITTRERLEEEEEEVKVDQKEEEEEEKDKVDKKENCLCCHVVPCRGPAGSVIRHLELHNHHLNCCHKQHKHSA